MLLKSDENSPIRPKMDKHNDGHGQTDTPDVQPDAGDRRLLTDIVPSAAVKRGLIAMSPENGQAGD